ncbi:hypothetical protein IG631_20230 [Alternaria alternata]|nr:hypothetical protein IG631_20230 [Alternaria alternata]
MPKNPGFVCGVNVRSTSFHSEHRRQQYRNTKLYAPSPRNPIRAHAKFLHMSMTGVTRKRVRRTRLADTPHTPYTKWISFREEWFFATSIPTPAHR